MQGNKFFIMLSFYRRVYSTINQAYFVLIFKYQSKGTENIRKPMRFSQHKIFVTQTSVEKNTSVKFTCHYITKLFQQHTCRCKSGLNRSPWAQHGRGVTLVTHPNLVPTSIMNRSYIPSFPWHLHGGSGTLYFTFYYALKN